MSDPHGEPAALSAGVAALKAAACDEIWCLGDLVGAPAPGETIRRAQETCDVVIAGNHDLLAVQRLPESYLESHGAEGMQWVREQLTAEHVRYLRELRVEARSDYLQAVHACIDP